MRAAIACLVILCVTAARPIVASSGTFQAFGYVRDTLGNPIPNLDVTGDDYVGDFYTFKTDATGYYSVDFDSDGNYRITPSCAQLNARGYACASSVAITVADASVEVGFVVQPQPFQISSSSLPRGNVGVHYSMQLAVVGGKAPFLWRLAADSSELPAGLTLTTAGLLSGTPLVHTASSIHFEVSDANSAVTNKSMTLTINPLPSLTPALWATNRFSMYLSGGSNQNYTVQVATNLPAATWSSVLVTNHRTANTFLVSDPAATNLQRTYRVLIGP